LHFYVFLLTSLGQPAQAQQASNMVGPERRFHDEQKQGQTTLFQLP
jgi:hypothetical protein